MFIIFFDHYQQATNSPGGGRCIQNLSARRNAPSNFFVSFRLPRSLARSFVRSLPLTRDCLYRLLSRSPPPITLFSLTHLGFLLPSFSLLFSIELFVRFQATAGVRQRSKAIQGRRTGNVPTRIKKKSRMGIDRQDHGVPVGLLSE